VQEGAEKAATKAVEKATTMAVERAATRAAEKAIQKVVEKDAEKAQLTGVRPDEQKGPTEIRFFVFLVDVDAIDDTDQNFIAKVFLRLQWRDERLADPGRPLRQMRLDEVWNPQLLITNQRGGSRDRCRKSCRWSPTARLVIVSASTERGLNL
jgi:hypothetical protein